MKFFKRHVRHMRAADGKLIHNFPPPKRDKINTFAVVA